MSVGEVRTTEQKAARPTIEAVRRRRPEALILTTSDLGEGYDERVLVSVDERDELLGELDAQAARIVELESTLGEVLTHAFPLGAYQRWQKTGDAADAATLDEYDEVIQRARAGLAGGKRT